MKRYFKASWGLKKFDDEPSPKEPLRNESGSSTKSAGAGARRNDNATIQGHSGTSFGTGNFNGAATIKELSKRDFKNSIEGGKAGAQRNGLRRPNAKVSAGEPVVTCPNASKRSRSGGDYAAKPSSEFGTSKFSNGIKQQMPQEDSFTRENSPEKISNGGKQRIVRKNGSAGEPREKLDGGSPTSRDSESNQNGHDQKLEKPDPLKKSNGVGKPRGGKKARGGARGGKRPSYDRRSKSDKDPQENGKSNGAVKAVRAPRNGEASVAQEAVPLYGRGDLLWSKIGQSSFWPCMVIDDPMDSRYYRPTRHYCIYYVQYFGHEIKHGWTMGPNRVVPYRGLDAFREYARDQMARNPKKHDSKFFEHEFKRPDSLANWDQALREVEEAKLILPESRRHDELRFEFYTPDDNKAARKKQKRASASRSGSTSQGGAGPGEPAGANSRPEARNGNGSHAKGEADGGDLNNNQAKQE